MLVGGRNPIKGLVVAAALLLLAPTNAGADVTPEQQFLTSFRTAVHNHDRLALYDMVWWGNADYGERRIRKQALKHQAKGRLLSSRLVDAQPGDNDPFPTSTGSVVPTLTVVKRLYAKTRWPGRRTHGGTLGPMTFTNEYWVGQHDGVYYMVAWEVRP